MAKANFICDRVCEIEALVSSFITSIIDIKRRNRWCEFIAVNDGYWYSKSIIDRKKNSPTEINYFSDTVLLFCTDANTK